MTLSKEERKARRLCMARERAARWRAANPERKIEQNRQYREKNQEREKHRKLNWWMGKIGAIDPTAPAATATAVARRVWLFGNCCAYCGGDGPLHLDHVQPLSRGGLHTPGNLVPACQRCNISKQAKPVEAWYLSQPFFSPERWEVLQAHTSRQWSTAEQLSFFDLLAESDSNA